MIIDSPRFHAGISNASAAVFVDDSRFLVADDEDQHRTLLRLYDTREDGLPLVEYHLSTNVLDPDPDEPEIDLEGAAWHNGRIFWIGSHSRSRKGKPRPSRHRLFATRLEEGQPIICGTPYRTLIPDLERVLDRKLDRALPPKDGGVSIEGLSSTASNELLIAFRSPLVKGKALVIALRNVDEVVDHGAAAQFGEPVLIDLDGRGIRSLEYWPERSSYLLIAGPEGDGDEPCALMRWTGPLSSHPETLDGVKFEDLGVEGAPEGLLIERGAGTVHIIFDEGRREQGDPGFTSVAIRDLLPAAG